MSHSTPTSHWRWSRLAYLTVLLVCTPLMGAAVASAQTPYDVVTGTVHNFGGSTAAQDACAGCHLPPPAPAGGEAALFAVTPIWGGAGNLAGNFPVARLGNGITYEEFPDTSSACLSCHDGVLATSVHQQVGAVTPERGGTRAPEHPIRIPYPRGTGGNFVVPTPLPQSVQFWSVPNIVGNNIVVPTGPMSTYQPIAPGGDPVQQQATLVRLRDGQIHCESCHNPHDNQMRPFLRALPPQLCLVCHDK